VTFRPARVNRLLGTSLEAREQRELLEKFASLSGEETNPAASRFWSKVSEILGKE
jgi:hypothetical protein